jgi:hypothetical protein
VWCTNAHTNVEILLNRNRWEKCQPACGNQSGFTTICVSWYILVQPQTGVEFQHNADLERSPVQGSIIFPGWEEGGDLNNGCCGPARSSWPLDLSPLQSEISFYANPHPRSHEGRNKNTKGTLLQCGRNFPCMRKGTAPSGLDPWEARRLQQRRASP